MSLEKAKVYLSEKGFDVNKVIEFDTSSATVELAAQALGCEAGMIAKSVTFALGEKTALIVAAGDTKIDNVKFKAYFGVKAKMLTFDEVIERVGYAVGGVCPFGVNDGTEVYLDASLKRYEYVYPACGSSNSCVKLSIAELEELSGYKAWLDVCKAR